MQTESPNQFYNSNFFKYNIRKIFAHLIDNQFVKRLDREIKASQTPIMKCLQVEWIKNIILLNLHDYYLLR